MPSELKKPEVGKRATKLGMRMSLRSLDQQTPPMYITMRCFFVYMALLRGVDEKVLFARCEKRRFPFREILPSL